MTAAQDTVIRLALASMAADRDSSLTVPQRQWILDLAHRTTALTPGERAKLRGPLLAWCAARMPRITSIVERQFTEDPRETREIPWTPERLAFLAGQVTENDSSAAR